MSVLQQTVSLAAQLRAFSSLLSLPSRAQSVIKAFRRQGIGSADGLILPASSSPDLKAFPLCSKSSKSSEGGQGETVSSTSFQPQTRLTLASALGRWWFLVTVCACGGKTLISRLNLSPSATCRALTGLPPMAFAVSFRIRFADAKTAAKHHRPTHIRPLGPHHKCTLISRPTAVHHGYIYIESVRWYSCHFTALLPMCIRLT